MYLSECPEPLNRFAALQRENWLRRFGRLEGLQNDILRVLKHPALKTLIDERLNFGFGDVNGHESGPSSSLLHFGSRLVVVGWVSTPFKQAQAGAHGPRP